MGPLMEAARVRLRGWCIGSYGSSAASGLIFPGATDNIKNVWGGILETMVPLAIPVPVPL